MLGCQAYEVRHNRSFDTSRLKNFGQACYFLEEVENTEKFERTAKPGVFVGYGQLRSYYILDLELYLETKGQARIVQTRDVKFPSELRYPLAPQSMFEPQARTWIAELFIPTV